MSHRQAYHTSCREGLGHSGFQFNAASPGIGPELLGQLAAAHVGYHAPRDMPSEPTQQDLAGFPVSLKAREVDGTPVVSRTVYVGREFRGQDGEPDTGRFGNYFSHVVLADPEAAEPFDGLLAIELWQAAHWRSTESRICELPELGTLQPGHCDLQWALEQLPDPGIGWHGAVLDAVLGALGGGPRVVLVEMDTERAAAWVAWVTFALPADLAPRLSFTTFDGQPRHAQDVHLCVTTPGCDVAFAEHELGREVLLLNLTGDVPPSTRLLYARVASTLARDGPEALAAVVTRSGSGDVRRRGAKLALRTGLVTLAAEEHVPSILELLVELARADDWGLVVQAAQALPASAGSEETLHGWWTVHAEARHATAAPARELADQALSRLIERIVEIPADLPDISAESSTSPSPGLLAGWLEQVEAAPSGAARATILNGGLRLGLVGCNVALDRRVAGVIADTIDAPEMKQTLTALAIGGAQQELVDRVIARLARDAFADDSALPRLRNTLTNPAFADTTRRFAARVDAFDERVVWERLRVEADPHQLAGALATLIPIAVHDGRTSEVRRVFGPTGPVSAEDHVTLLRAFERAGVDPAEHDIDCALHALAQIALTDTVRGRPLFELLRSAAPGSRLLQNPGFALWAAACCPPGANFAKWCDWVAVAAVAPVEQLSDERFRELVELAGTVVVTSLDVAAAEERHRREVQLGKRPAGVYDAVADYAAGVAKLAQAFGMDWPQLVSAALRRELSKGRAGSWFGAAAFRVWSDLPAGTGELSETALPEALETQSPRRIAAIEERLGEREREKFAHWLERHPSRAGVSGAVSRLLHRDERRA